MGRRFAFSVLISLLSILSTPRIASADCNENYKRAVQRDELFLNAAAYFRGQSTGGTLFTTAVIKFSNSFEDTPQEIQRRLSSERAILEILNFTEGQWQGSEPASVQQLVVDINNNRILKATLNNPISRQEVVSFITGANEKNFLCNGGEPASYSDVIKVTRTALFTARIGDRFKGFVRE